MHICDFCGDQRQTHVPAGAECLATLRSLVAKLSEEADTLKKANLGLRFRIHQLEHHRPRFHACESAWCNPVEDWNPALQHDGTRVFDPAA